MDRISKSWRPLLVCSLLSAVTLATFWPVLSNGFIRFDDPFYVVRNGWVRGGLTWAGVGWAFRAGYQANWHPLTWISHMLDVQLFGLWPGGHHLSSLLLHTANALLLFWLLRRWTGAEWRSAFVAAFFALHPLHVESVAWVAERKDVLSTFFFLLTLLAYTAYVRSQGSGARSQKPESSGASRFRFHISHFIHPVSTLQHFNASRWYVLTFVLFACGLMSKPMLVTLPFLLLLLDYWPLQRLALSTLNCQTEPCFPLSAFRFPFFEKLPLFALAAASCVVTFLVQARSHATTYLHLPLAARAANAVVSYLKYLAKTLWPVDLAIFYPHPDRLYPISHQWPGWQVMAAAAFLAAVSLLALLRLKRQPWFAVGWFWFLGTLVPVIGLVQVGGQAMADRYTYIPLIGLFLSAVWGAADLGGWCRSLTALPGFLNDSRRLARTALYWALPAIGLPALAACACLAHKQVTYWHDNLAVFTHALAVTSDNALAHYNVAVSLADQHQFGPALAHLRVTTALDPSFADAYSKEGEILESLGRKQEALELFRAALRAAPQVAWRHSHLACLLWELGHQEEALAEYAAALRADPAFTDAHYNLGIALSERGDWTGAARHFAAVVRLKPDDAETFLHLAEAYSRTGHLAQALDAATKARDLARATGQTNLLQTAEARLNLYRKQQPSQQ